MSLTNQRKPQLMHHQKNDKQTTTVIIIIIIIFQNYLTVGTAQYIIMTHDIALALMTSERAPVVIPPIHYKQKLMQNQMAAVAFYREFLLHHKV